MDTKQYKRWKDFALRMARTCWHSGTRPPKEWVVGKVEDFFRMNFELSDGGPEESSIEHLLDWDHVERDASRFTQYPVCDLLDLWSSDVNPWYYAPEGGWEDEAYDQFQEQWIGAVHCCVRAGIDLAVAPSAGVAGFTAGQVRKMYPDGVPAWAKEGWCGPDDEPVQWENIPDDKYVWL